MSMTAEGEISTGGDIVGEILGTVSEKNTETVLGNESGEICCGNGEAWIIDTGKDYGGVSVGEGSIAPCDPDNEQDEVS